MLVDISTAVENQNQTEKVAAIVPDTSAARSGSAEDSINDNELPSLSNEDIQMTECDTVHVLEKLELTQDAQEFLASDQSKRRPATCIEIDPSLKKAVDIIRDNLLRQTMEELWKKKKKNIIDQNYWVISDRTVTGTLTWALKIYFSVTVPKYSFRLQRVSLKFHVRFLK